MSDCTRCSSDSRDLAGEDGADVPRELPRRLSERSPPTPVPLPALGATGTDDVDALPMLPPVAEQTNDDLQTCEYMISLADQRASFV